VTASILRSDEFISTDSKYRVFPLFDDPGRRYPFGLGEWDFQTGILFSYTTDCVGLTIDCSVTAECSGGFQRSEYFKVHCDSLLQKK
jgi:hypothetical protein